jgi:ribosome-binding factor A
VSDVADGDIKRKGRTASLLKDVISSFIRFEVNPDAMVTVMRIEMESDLRLARAFISVFPEEKEKEIMGLLKKRGRILNDFRKTKTKLRFLPNVIFEIDKGWKLEQKMEELLK